MKHQFNDRILPPDFYQGDITEDNGAIKIEWREPGHAQKLLTESDLRALEESSRIALCTGNLATGSDEWKRQRNINYSAEYGLEKLQLHKLACGKSLDTAFRPVIPN